MIINKEVRKSIINDEIKKNEILILSIILKRLNQFVLYIICSISSTILKYKYVRRV